MLPFTDLSLPVDRAIAQAHACTNNTAALGQWAFIQDLVLRYHDDQGSEATSMFESVFE